MLHLNLNSVPDLTNNLIISAAENVEDVDEDDVLIIDGLTKRFRLPGWRIAWIVGPKVCLLSLLPE